MSDFYFQPSSFCSNNDLLRHKKIRVLERFNDHSARLDCLEPGLLLFASLSFIYLLDTSPFNVCWPKFVIIFSLHNILGYFKESVFRSRTTFATLAFFTFALLLL